MEAPVELHYFYEDDLPGIVAWNAEQEVCRVAYDTPVTYSVAGFITTPEGELVIGPESDDLVVVWPVPEPEAWQMLLGGYLLLMFLFWRRQHL
jgi:hypothetical protein